jgi:hypothetical protein
MKKTEINMDFSPIILGGTKEKTPAFKVLPFNEKQEKTFKLHYSKFIEAMKSIGFEKISSQEAVVDIQQKKLKKPERVRMEQSLGQDRFEFFSRTGYGVVVYPGTFSHGFGKYITSFIHIVNEDKERIWTRNFLRRDIKTFFNVVIAYAQTAKNVVSQRKVFGKNKAFMNLTEKDITRHVWKKGRKEIAFDFSAYTCEAMSDEEMLAVFRKEFHRKQYFTKYRTAHEYMRDIRKKWKKAKKD